MKFYPRDPDRALNGMRGLTLEQVGAYNLILDLLYSRDGVVAADDVGRMLKLDPRLWQRLKAELMRAGKIRIRPDGLLDANGVTSTLLVAELHSRSAKHAADVRWRHYKIAKENNDPTMRGRNASYIKSKRDSSTNSESEIAAAPEKEVAEKSQAVPVSGELEGIIRDKIRERRWLPP